MSKTDKKFVSAVTVLLLAEACTNGLPLSRRYSNAGHYLLPYCLHEMLDAHSATLVNRNYDPILDASVHKFGGPNHRNWEAPEWAAMRVTGDMLVRAYATDCWINDQHYLFNDATAPWNSAADRRVYNVRLHMLIATLEGVAA